MRILVTQQVRFSPDGIRVDTYQVGECEVPDEVADLAVRERWARPLNEPVVQLGKRKMLRGAPSNKSA